MKKVQLGGLFVAFLCGLCVIKPDGLIPSQASLMPYGGRCERFLMDSEKNPLNEREAADSPGFKVGGVVVAEGRSMDEFYIRSIKILSNNQPHRPTR